VFIFTSIVFTETNVQEKILIVKKSLENIFLVEGKFKTPVEKRLFEAIRALQGKELIKDQSDLARRIGETSQDFTDIKGGKKKASREILDKFFEAFPEVNRDYVLKGTGGLFDSDIEPEDVKLQKLEGEYEAYKEYVHQKIQALEAEVKYLKKRLGDI
jgi:hypothetical protein